MRVENPDDITVPPDGQPASVQPKWRQDFPIDWPQDEYLSRRHFVGLLALTSFAFVVGQAWIVVLGAMRKARGKPPLKEIARVDEMPIGGAKLFYYPGESDTCILVRVKADQFVAYDQKCTHLSCPVIPKPAQGIFYCPCHEGRFDLLTGEPMAGPPRRPLPRIDIQILNGRIYATGIRKSSA